MKKKSNMILGFFDFLLAIGAIYGGILAIKADTGIFAEYPRELLDVLPFKSWFLPGIICIVLFGAGNLFAALTSFMGKRNASWLFSAIAGGVLLICVILQIVLLGEWYLPLDELMVFSLVQLFLSGWVLLSREAA